MSDAPDEAPDTNPQFSSGALWGMSGGMLELLRIEPSVSKWKGCIDMVFTDHDHPDHEYRITVWDSRRTS